jgi:hypothetical protein
MLLGFDKASFKSRDTAVVLVAIPLSYSGVDGGKGAGMGRSRNPDART